LEKIDGLLALGTTSEHFLKVSWYPPQVSEFLKTVAACLYPVLIRCKRLIKFLDA